LRQYAADGLRPQTLLFSLLGRHVLDRDVAVASSTFIDVLGLLDISVQATRSTLTRLVSRGHLIRHRMGRKAYFSISDRLRVVLHDGESRIFEAPVRDVPENVWTLLSFSIPEERRSDRHSLRAALDWNGFGLLRNGLWIAPGEVDASRMVDRLGLQERVDVFTCVPAGPTDMHSIVREAWDLDQIAERYEQFSSRWAEGFPPGVDDTLAAHVLLITEWQQVLVEDPELPVQYAPAGWPAMDAYAIFRRRQTEFGPEATQIFEGVLDAVPEDELPVADD
jgi:phenylacetic acid degradation operon negative regulatory protein